ncbi:MAG: chromosomal replication initiator protein DnaA [Candidatus Brocadia sp. AMX2]|uniref:chromosomal replication initiator protein DnaA n=1 Tax=Candidatus Brocadia sp. AMX2 TaxID=2293635 RepID=UPI000798C0F1|nr:chromosomal replication initiator protein DnaA [Candidatus Brocadia sp. AMX2]KXK27874.1 MAG: chromosomal replication initiator protein DnaA [Candidatus Brocadia sinica]MBC6933691.1 chromosomal replication initiator protein DnaA [Candidatus Brocadia sp.]MBL1170482.1 chromosomal replication initiator protein DnaA [Candidatus Brocadia sp. AMX1]NOG40053.1 chromosomal replication initiator protein DnaA [Planctomycetota bacterium]KAA0243099.1 MAG: chromosomal replication initiator protein DnaA [C
MELYTKVWDDVLQNIREKVGPLRFNLWFKNTRLESFDDNNANILVPNVFTQVWLQENFSNVLREGIGKLVNKDLNIKFSVSKNGEDENVPTMSIPLSEKKTNGNKNYAQLNRNLRLEDFVVGTNNRLAYTAALEMIKDKYPAFNPLFIHGPVGVGKTHILQGVWNRVKEEQNVNAIYMPAEKWTNEFIYSLQKGKMEAFRQKFRNADIFLIDDVHFLSNKQGVQEEFLHTFNALFELSKRIILASDAHPKMIGQLKENLASRFMSGMVTKIDKPEYATRLLILRSKAAKFDVHFPEEVLEFVAEKFDGNVREVESALTTLSAHAKFNEKKMDLHLASDALGEFFCAEGKIIKINEIEATVLNYFNISRNELHSNKKMKSISFPRQICMYLIKTLLNWSYQQIGNYFTSKKHTTVMFAIKKVKEQIDSDKQFKLFIESLIEKIKKERK